MDREELAVLDRRLRQFATENGMAWVVEELDDAIATGVIELRELRQSKRQGRTTYDDVPQTRRAGRKRAEEFVSRRSLTQEEKTRMMVAGLRRVLADLDQVAAASVVQLNDLDSVTQSPDDVELTESAEIPARSLPGVAEIDFAPDEGSTAVAVSTEAIRHFDRSHNTAAVLRRIEAEIE